MQQQTLGTNKRRILRTLRCKNRNVVGTLAELISTLSDNGADIGLFKTVAMGDMHNIRDISIMVGDEKHLELILEKVRELKNIELLQVIDEVLDVHQGGKLRVIPTYPVHSLDDLRKVYTPGVAQVCVMIKREPEMARKYTTIPRNVALVTNGSRLLGLGNMGPVAAMPVMEGKAALFTQLTGLNMFPILLETRDPKKFVETVVEIASGFGAIQLEDIEAPECFEIEDALKERLNIPVMHDDQHGTAVVTLAAAIQACRLVGRNMKDLKIGQIGLGAAGHTIAHLVSRYVGKPVMGSDVSEDACARHQKRGGIVTDMATIMRECDVVIATTGRKNLIKADMIRKGQVILALSNPYPEITAQEAIDAGASFAGDGSRVNNLLGYPGIFKGAMDVGASQITEEMLLAAAQAIADSAPEKELVPEPIDQALHDRVAHAVAECAFRCGVARVKPEIYYHKPRGLTPH